MDARFFFWHVCTSSNRQYAQRSQVRATASGSGTGVFASSGAESGAIPEKVEPLPPSETGTKNAQFFPFSFPQSALRAGVDRSGAPRHHSFIPHRFRPPQPLCPNGPIVPQLSPHNRLTGRDTAVFRAGRGTGATRSGKPAHRASQEQTAGNGLGGPLGQPAAPLHRHFRPMILLSA